MKSRTGLDGDMGDCPSKYEVLPKRCVMISFVRVVDFTVPPPSDAVKIASGGITLNSNSVLYGNILAPSGTVTINNLMIGTMAAERLTINSTGVLRNSP